MKRSPLFFLFAALMGMVALSQEAFSCPFSPPSANEQEAQKIFNKADFVGRGRILSFGPTSENYFTFEIVESYQGISKGNIKVYGLNDCGRLGIPKGRIYEELLYKDDVGHYRYAPTDVFSFYSKEIEILREGAKTTQKLEGEKAYCSIQNGIWIDHIGYYPTMSDCHYPTGDKGKKCLDSNECQGFCLPETINDFQQADSKASGMCSEWKNIHNVKRGLMQNGTVSQQYHGELSK